MTRITKALQTAFEAGLDHYPSCPDETLTVVHRYASKTYPTKDEAIMFVQGFSQARARRDDYLREQDQ